MIRVIVSGACGHMGQILTAAVEKDPETALAAGVDAFAEEEGIFKTFSDDIPEADIIIDFSHHTAVGAILEFAKKRQLPVIIATTGHDDAEKALINEAAGEIPVFYSGNMSLGIAILVQLAKKTAAAFPDADIEIVEVHHNRKLDAPSGTAAMLANAVKEVRPEAELVYGRSGNCKRQPNEIGMHSLRMGNIVGIHEVIISTQTQAITLKHEAFDRGLFADGAISAAKAMMGRGAGLYGMQDII